MYVRSRVLPITAALLLSLAACGGDEADTATEDTAAPAPEAEAAACGTGESSLAGKDVRLVVGTDPGGGYDAYARMIAPFLAEELGAKVVVENEPGAGGLKAVNSMLAGKKDGTHLMIMNATGNMSSQIAGVQGANFEPGELTYIGRVAHEPEVVTGGADGPYKTWQDVIDSGDAIKIGTTGLGSAAYINGAFVADIFDLDADLITGYESASEAELGLLSGDIQLLPGNLDSRMKQIEAGDSIALLGLSDEPIEELPDVPLVQDFDLDAEQTELLEAHNALGEIGRPLIGPPGMEEEAATDLRRAMQCAFEGEELQAAAEEAGRPISYRNAEEVAELAQEIASPPDAYREFLVRAYEGT
jgi:tripartite-type tricarboxylate transporter receptor subunit TctC